MKKFIFRTTKVKKRPHCLSKDIVKNILPKAKTTPFRGKLPKDNSFRKKHPFF